MSIEAMKLALEALEEPKEHFAKHRRLEAVIALRAAIEQAKPWVKTYANGEPQYTTPEEQPEQEPVAWMNPSWIDPDTRGWANDSFDSIHIEGWVPLYTAPRREWQGLTDEEVSEILDREIGFNSCFGPETNFARAIESKLREKNT